MTYPAFKIPRGWAVVAVAAVAFVASSCSFGVDPDGAARFSCTKAADCGAGYECRLQKNREGGLCFRLGQCADAETKCDGKDEDCNGVVDDVEWAGEACASSKPGICSEGHRACVDGNEACQPNTQGTAEVCNNLDDDCDGWVDEDFDFATDNANCGGCGIACAAGSTCVAQACTETNCADGIDNDGDGLVDCNDPNCLDQSCSMEQPGFVCRLLPLVPDGGNLDGGDPDGGLSDAGPSTDAGLDGGNPDAGPSDAGVDDAGTISDAGTDGGNPDAGVTDAGVVRVPQCAPREVDCSNGVDDDGDSKIDCDDSDCAGSVTCVDAGI